MEWKQNVYKSNKVYSSFRSSDCNRIALNCRLILASFSYLQIKIYTTSVRHEMNKKTARYLYNCPEQAPIIINAKIPVNTKMVCLFR